MTISNVTPPVTPQLSTPKQPTGYRKAEATVLATGAVLTAGHAPDTVVKRLQAKPTTVSWRQCIPKSSSPPSFLNTATGLYQFFRQHRLPVALEGKTGWAAFRSVNNGLVAAFCYKGPQLGLKYGFLDTATNGVQKHIFGLDSPPTELRKRLLVKGVTGAFLGWAEALTLYPLDVVKTHRQTGGTLAQLATIVKQEPTLGGSIAKLYPGLPFVMIRNGIGSFSLIAGNEAGKALQGLGEYEQGSFANFILSSSLGSLCSIAVPYPLDTVRTFLSQPTRPRLVDFQKFPLSQCYNGIGIKLISTVPKQALGFAAFQTLVSRDKSVFETLSDKFSYLFRT